MTDGQNTHPLWTKPPRKVCPHCGTVDRPKIGKSGSTAIDAILWCTAILVLFLASVSGVVGAAIILLSGWPLLLIPTLYSVWRVSSAHDVCRSCGDSGPIGLNTPRGKELVEKYGQQKEEEASEPPQPEPPPSDSNPQPAQDEQPQPAAQLITKPRTKQERQQYYEQKKIRESLQTLGLSWEDLKMERGLSLQASYRTLLLTAAKSHSDPYVRKMAYLHLAIDAENQGANPFEYLRRSVLASLDEIEESGRDLGVSHVRIKASGCSVAACAEHDGELLTIEEAREQQPIPRTGPGRCVCHYEMVFPDEL